MPKADHKHDYERVLLRYASANFSWGGSCSVCGRIDAHYKASELHDPTLVVDPTGLYGVWEDVCLAAIRRQHPGRRIYESVKNGWKEL